MMGGWGGVGSPNRAPWLVSSHLRPPGVGRGCRAVNEKNGEEKKYRYTNARDDGRYYRDDRDVFYIFIVVLIDWFRDLGLPGERPDDRCCTADRARARTGNRFFNVGRPRRHRRSRGNGRYYLGARQPEPRACLYPRSRIIHLLIS